MKTASLMGTILFTLRAETKRKATNMRPAMQPRVGTLLIEIQRFPCFVYEDVRLQRQRAGQRSHSQIVIAPHASIHGKCFADEIN